MTKEMIEAAFAELKEKEKNAISIRRHPSVTYWFEVKLPWHHVASETQNLKLHKCEYIERYDRTTKETERYILATFEVKNGAYQQPKTTSQLAWHKANEVLPPINIQNELDAKYKISKRVLCYAKGWFGARFGYYYQESGKWIVEGVTSSNGIQVEYWMEVPLPETTN